MHFPESQRVIYTQNPLVEVICQLRFPRILLIDTQLPSGFHERIRGRYPLVNETGPLSPPGPLPPEVARLIGIDPGLLNVLRAFDFVSADGVWKVSLTSQFLSLTTTDYARWEQFKEHLRAVLDAFVKEYKPAFFSRVGLRYRDLIQRSKLKLEGAAWNKLLKAPLLGELADPAFDAAAEHVGRELVVRLDGAQEKVRLYHGFAKYQGRDETCYLIDADFFSEAQTEYQNAEAILDRFNREAGRLFRWCINDALDLAMGPNPIS
jgi:uncharacterized protein (TIGR04255 family)